MLSTKWQLKNIFSTNFQRCSLNEKIETFNNKVDNMILTMNKQITNIFMKTPYNGQCGANEISQYQQYSIFKYYSSRYTFLWTSHNRSHKTKTYLLPGKYYGFLREKGLKGRKYLFFVMGSAVLWRFRLSTERTSLQNLRASRSGRRHKRAVSVASQNHDVIGMALSAKTMHICYYLMGILLSWIDKE